MINAKEFIKALNELEAAKGISKDSIIEGNVVVLITL